MSNAHFQAKEKEGRDKFREEFEDFPIRFAEEPTSIWDAEVDVSGKTFVAEIKTRGVPSDAYDKWFLEYRKAKSLSERAKNNDHIDGVLYYNVFSDGESLTWDLGEVEDPEVKTKSCPKSTLKANGRKEKRLFLLDPEDAIM